MCISCGCGFLHDKHNNPNNITLDDLEKAAKSAGMSVEDAARNIANAVGLACEKK
ncbi:hypothetical protein MCP_2091 [Methanocella paludicola SANAE]|uniref:Uncharacterized protein n=1 Tax=Methanocella paludicola (strain DSM 17711 / JCM 13418 / NBRC 101707 / SANAE) TaxID=304371 RepID=D1Z0E1_METPS|nr:hypothetical protein [Methanocella paludicola]BAI62163.1 hypothetical protein MCP_2091 [Methanocella paludicola SANAE]